MFYLARLAESATATAEARELLDASAGRFCPEEHRWLTKTERLVIRKTADGPVAVLISEGW